VGGVFCGSRDLLSGVFRVSFGPVFSDNIPESSRKKSAILYVTSKKSFPAGGFQECGIMDRKKDSEFSTPGLSP
jgi:hypothetical protein